MSRGGKVLSMLLKCLDISNSDSSTESYPPDGQKVSISNKKEDLDCSCTKNRTCTMCSRTKPSSRKSHHSDKSSNSGCSKSKGCCKVCQDLRSPEGIASLRKTLKNSCDNQFNSHGVSNILWERNISVNFYKGNIWAFIF